MVLSTGFVNSTGASYIDLLPSKLRRPAPPADIIAIALRSHSPRALGNTSRWQCQNHSTAHNNLCLHYNHRCMRLSGLTSYVTSRLPRLRSRLLPAAMQHERQADVDDPSTAVSVLVDASQSKPGSTSHSYRHKRPPHSGQGILALLGVALLWGTYAPSFKYLFLLEHAPSPALAIAVQATLCALFLLTTVLISDSKEPVIKEHADDDISYDSSEPEHSQLLPRPLNASTAAAGHRPERQSTLRQPLQRWLKASSNRLHIAGAELGCWSFLGNALASLGLSLTTATKAAFLTQATGFMVPVLSYLSGEVVGALIWLSCGLGALGSSLVAVDSARIDTVAPVVALAAASTTSAGAAAAAGGVAAAAAGAGARSMLADAAAGAGAALADTAAVDTVLGEWLTLAACLFYALSTVRIGVYSRRFGGNELAFMSQASFALLALVWLCCDIMAAPQGVAWQMQHIARVFRNHTAVAVMLWIGLGPGAMASLLQMWGQKLVPASQAQVIFSSTPLWAGIIAQSVLKGEAMGMQGWIGSSVIIVATLLAAFVDVVAPAQSSSSSSSSSGAAWQKTSGGGAAGHKAADEG